MSIDNLLNRLDGVHNKGKGHYSARCPAHDDKSPSLSITECDDGRILMHCHAGCETHEVLSSIGMTFSDLMPERIRGKHSFQPIRRPFNTAQIVSGLAHEAAVVSLYAQHVEAYMPLERLSQAASRLMSGAEQLTRDYPEIKALRRSQNATSTSDLKTDVDVRNTTPASDLKCASTQNLPSAEINSRSNQTLTSDFKTDASVRNPKYAPAHNLAKVTSTSLSEGV